MFWLLIVLSAILGTLSVLINPECVGNNTRFQIAVIALILPIVMVFLIYLAIIFFGAVATWLGCWLGGSGSHQRMQAVLIWSGIPYLLAYLCWFIGIMAYGKPLLDLYIQDSGQHVFGFMMLPWLTFWVAVGYAEAHDFSLQKGLLIAVLTYVVPFILLYTLY